MAHAIPKRLSQEIQRQVVNRYIQGERRIDIARALGTKSEVITAILQRNGAKLRLDDKFARGFPQEIEEEIKNRYEAGESSNALARAYSRTPAGILKIVRRQGGVVRQRGGRYRDFTDDEIDEMARLWMGGESQTAIARELDTAQITVSRVLKSRGIIVDHRRPVGENHGSWKGGRIRSGGQYWSVYVSMDDPLADMRNRMGYVPEHRLVMARKLGRPLLSSETVHHLDGDPENNAEDNLQLRLGRHGKGQAYCCGDCGSQNIVPCDL